MEPIKDSEASSEAATILELLQSDEKKVQAEFLFFLVFAGVTDLLFKAAAWRSLGGAQLNAGRRPLA